MKKILEHLFVTLLLCVFGYLWIAFLAWDIFWGWNDTSTLRVMFALVLGIRLYFSTKEAK